MNLNDIIKSTLGLEDYNLYLSDDEFALADLSFDDTDITMELADQQYTYEQTHHEPDEVEEFIDNIEPDEEIDLYEFLN